MNEPTRSVLEKINTFRIVEVGDGGNKGGHAFAFVFVHMYLE